MPREALGVDFTILSASEISKSYRDFCEANYPGRIDHFFESIEDQIRTGKPCATCSASLMGDVLACGPDEVLRQRGLEVDILMTGSPCDPFSTQRNKRFANGGPTTHYLFDVTMQRVIDLYARYEPQRGIFEQVWGFCAPFEKGGKEVPKDRSLG